jgi:hypothetical protein
VLGTFIVWDLDIVGYGAILHVSAEFTFTQAKDAIMTTTPSTTTLTRDELREVWIAALESGEYSQCTGMLERTHPDHHLDGLPRQGFCCLGVISWLASKRPEIGCDVVRRERLIDGSSRVDRRIEYSESFSDGGDSHGSCESLVDSLWKALGLMNQDGNLAVPMVEGVVTPKSLAHANDRGDSFQDIAKMLRSGIFWAENSTKAVLKAE